MKGSGLSVEGIRYVVEKVGLLQLQGSRFWMFRCGYIAFMTYIHCHTRIPKVKGT